MKRLPIHGGIDSAPVDGLVAVRWCLLPQAGRTHQDDAGHRVIIATPYIPSLTDSASRFGQLGIAVPAAALARCADRFQRFTNIDGKPPSFCQVAHNLLRPPHELFRHGMKCSALEMTDSVTSVMALSCSLVPVTVICLGRYNSHSSANKPSVTLPLSTKASRKASIHPEYSGTVSPQRGPSRLPRGT